MKTILIAGGSGLVGRSVTEVFLRKKYAVRWLTRTPAESNKVGQFFWDPMNGEMDEKALKDTDVIINLSGAGIADRIWTPSRKKLLLDSRIKSTELIYTSCKKTGHWPKKYIAASAVGIYGSKPGEILTEESPKGQGFLADLCEKWEEVAELFQREKVPVVKVRIGMVLAEKGGSLPVFKKLAKLPIVAVPNGKQYVPWIHIHDLETIFLKAAEENALQGIVNGVSPNPVSLKTMLNEINRVQQRKRWVAGIPAFPFKLLAGDMSEIVISDQQVVPQLLQQLAFEWRYPTIAKALETLLK